MLWASSMKTRTHLAFALALIATVGCADNVMERGGGDVADEGDDDRGSAFGEAQYPRLQLDEDDTTGLLVINDEAAERMFADMTSAAVDPEIEDMKDRKPAQVSLNDCEGRIGRHIICRKVPRFTDDGEALELDSDGNLLYLHQCFVNLQDFTRGEAVDNDTAVEPQ